MDFGVLKTKFKFECRRLDGDLAYAAALFIYDLNFNSDCNAYCLVVD